MSTNFRALFLLLLGLVAAFPAWALNPAIPLVDLNHASWTDREGAPADVVTMAQSKDGWLWLGTQDGLYKFDGVRFERQPMKRNRIYHLLALDNGDLLISYFNGGLSLLKADGKVEDFDGPHMPFEPVSAMVRANDGVIWAGSRSGLFRYRQGVWTVVDAGSDWRGRLVAVLLDQYGRIWASNDAGVYLLDPATLKLARVGDGPGGSLTQSPDGRLWVVNADNARVVPAPPTATQLPRRAGFNQAESRWGGQFDADGNFWAMRCPVGICRVVGNEVRARSLITPAKDARERLDQEWQLSATSAAELLEDREGNIWAMTRSGIDRFRENKLAPVHIPSAEGVFNMASDQAGQLWVADFNVGALWKVSPHAPPVRDQSRFVQMLANDRNGALLLAGKREIERIDHGISSKIPLPEVNGKAIDLRVIGMLDDGKILWMSSLQTGLMAMVDGHWEPRSAFHLPRSIQSVAAADTGQLWLGDNKNTLSFYDNGKLSKYDIGVVGVETGIFPGTPFLVAGEHGIAVLHGQKFELLGPADVDALRNVTGLTVTPDGDRWLNGARGLVRIRPDDWKAALAGSGKPLKYELIDALDGYLGQAERITRLPSILNAGNGRLWVLGTAGLMFLDTGTLRPNTVKPSIQLLHLNTDSGSYAPSGKLRLPPDSRNFSIQYTAPGLRKPEGMRFQYMLDGVDRRWIDAGRRRTAYYTNVGPGAYTFRVRAINEDGIASAAPATLSFEVAPTLPQTWWFRLLCGAALLAILYCLYRYRVGLAMAESVRQAHARTDERERIARTLHDTFLQSVYALMLQVYSVLMKLPEDSESRLKLKTILDIANRTIEEGRAQVAQLRAGYDAEQMLNRIGGSLSTIHTGTAFQIRVRGTRRRLSAAAQEEISGVGQEAVHNAFQHAAGSRVSVSIVYGSDSLVLRVTDNGKGLDDGQAQLRIREGHWGLVGMRERAKRVGGLLQHHSKTGKGTRVTFRIPARVAYEPE